MALRGRGPGEDCLCRLGSISDREHTVLAAAGGARNADLICARCRCQYGAARSSRRRLMSGEIADVRYRGADVAKDAGCGKAFMFSSSRVIMI